MPPQAARHSPAAAPHSHWGSGCPWQSPAGCPQQRRAAPEAAENEQGAAHVDMSAHVLYSD